MNITQTTFPKLYWHKLCAAVWLLLLITPLPSIAATPDLTVTSTIAAYDSEFVVGQSFLLNLKISSKNAASSNVRFVTGFPSSLQYINSGGECEVINTKLNCSIGSLAAEETRQIAIGFKAVSPTDRGLISTVVSTSQTESNTDNNRAASTISVIASEFDLSVDSDLANNSIISGEQVQLTARVSNNSTNSATQLIYTANYPDTLHVISINAEDWKCSDQTDQSRVYCWRASLANSSASQINIEFQAHGSTHTAKIISGIGGRGTGEDINVENDTHSASLSVATPNACDYDLSGEPLCIYLQAADTTQMPMTNYSMHLFIAAREAIDDGITINLWNSLSAPIGTIVQSDAETMNCQINSSNRLSCTQTHTLHSDQQFHLQIPFQVPASDKSWQQFASSLRISYQHNNAVYQHKLPFHFQIDSEELAQNHQPGIYPNQTLTIDNSSSASTFPPQVYAEDWDTGTLQFSIDQADVQQALMINQEGVLEVIDGDALRNLTDSNQNLLVNISVTDQDSATTQGTITVHYISKPKEGGTEQATNNKSGSGGGGALNLFAIMLLVINWLTIRHAPRRHAH